MKALHSISPFVSILTLLLYPNQSVGVPFPMISNPKIISCGGTHCSALVMYGSDGVKMVDVAPVVPPDPKRTKKLVPTGVHCESGDAMLGEPFRDCVFTSLYQEHAPYGTGPCELRSVDSWELTSGSTCTTNTTWGPHGGAGPGGECVVFAQGQTLWSRTLVTIFGVLDAEQTANSGNTFCQKPLPPDVSCSVELPTVMDHGTVSPNESSSVSVDGSVDCGSSPTVAIVGGGHVVLGEGVSATLTPVMVGNRVLRLTSHLSAVNAAPGAHKASVIVRVSPY